MAHPKYITHKEDIQEYDIKRADKRKIMAAFEFLDSNGLETYLEGDLVKKILGQEKNYGTIQVLGVGTEQQIQAAAQKLQTTTRTTSPLDYNPNIKFSITQNPLKEKQYQGKAKIFEAYITSPKDSSASPIDISLVTEKEYTKYKELRQ